MGRQQKKKDPNKKKKQGKSAQLQMVQDDKNRADALPNKPKNNVLAKVTSGISNKSNGKPSAGAPKMARKAPAGSQTDNVIGKSIQFLREVRVELKKVTWPSRKQTIGSTAVVLLLVFVVGFFLGIVDMGLSGLVKMILN
ncbi:MAG: preprotein translocase subunit SecE [Thermodesulfobacteriota bacterium]|nr:preprotein translocase subunit SecE [Thermodesulfobacteriota bacterium]